MKGLTSLLFFKYLKDQFLTLIFLTYLRSGAKLILDSEIPTFVKSTERKTNPMNVAL